MLVKVYTRPGSENSERRRTNPRRPLTVAGESHPLIEQQRLDAAFARRQLADVSVAQLHQMSQLFICSWTRAHECCAVDRRADSPRVSWHRVDWSSLVVPALSAPSRAPPLNKDTRRPPAHRRARNPSARLRKQTLPVVSENASAHN